MNLRRFIDISYKQHMLNKAFSLQWTHCYRTLILGYSVSLLASITQPHLLGFKRIHMKVTGRHTPKSRLNIQRVALEAIAQNNDLDHRMSHRPLLQMSCLHNTCGTIKEKVFI